MSKKKAKPERIGTILASAANAGYAPYVGDDVGAAALVLVKALRAERVDGKMIPVRIGSRTYTVTVERSGGPPMPPISLYGPPDEDA